MTIDERWGTNPEDFRTYDTERIRREFLVERLFEPGRVRMTYTHNDRLVIGGAQPSGGPLELPAPELLRADYFCERRELGVVCIGGDGFLEVDGRRFAMGYKDAVYVGRGARKVMFGGDAKFYFASAPAHKEYPTAQITAQMRRTRELGGRATSNERTLNQLILNDITPCCQLQMGLTELHEGNVWNTMPPHTHSRRMEAYFYFGVPEGQAVCHFMGEPQQTRHLFVGDGQAVISPSWSIHSAAGTSCYTFIWAMCGENLDYDDMDTLTADKLR